jgi:hypothetical protein
MGAIFFIVASGVSNLVEYAENGVFRRFDTRLFLWKCQKRHFWNITSPRVDDHRMESTFLNFGLIGCKSTKKCAKSTIFNIKVKIRKSKCHQKIPYIRFSGNNISNYGLIFKTNSAREQNEIFIEKPFFFLESAVDNWPSIIGLFFTHFQVKFLRNLESEMI